MGTGCKVLIVLLGSAAAGCAFVAASDVQDYTLGHPPSVLFALGFGAGAVLLGGAFTGRLRGGFVAAAVGALLPATTMHLYACDGSQHIFPALGAVMGLVVFHTGRRGMKRLLGEVEAAPSSPPSSGASASAPTA